MTSARVTEAAPAKLTLSLRVLGTRPDGFHDLEALVVALTFGDTLEVARSGAPGVRLAVTGPACAGVPTDGTNLVVRALDALGGGFDANLHKVVPPGAGLGGGSSDAAAALRAGARLLGEGSGRGVVETSPPDRGARFQYPPSLRAVAASLGSDVPFCLQGGTAWMRGRGEVIDPLPAVEQKIGADLSLVVAVPPFGVSTPAVYRAWDELGGPRSERAAPAPAGLEHLLPDGLLNDLEPAALAVEPRLRAFRHALEAVSMGTAAGSPPVMAGSGSAYFFLCAISAAAEAAAELRSHIAGSWAFVSGPAR